MEDKHLVAIRSQTNYYAVLHFSPGTDTFLEDMTRNAGRVFYFDEGTRAATKLISKAIEKRRRARPSWRHEYNPTHIGWIAANPGCHCGMELKPYLRMD